MLLPVRVVGETSTALQNSVNDAMKEAAEEAVNEAFKEILGEAVTEAVHTSIARFEENLQDLQERVEDAEARLEELEKPMHSRNEFYMRKEAEKQFGESFVKGFLVRSIMDMVCLLSTVSDGSTVVSDKAENQLSLAHELIAKADLKILMKPTIGLFLDQIDPQTIEDNEDAKEKLEKALAEAKTTYTTASLEGTSLEESEDALYKTTTALIAATKEAGIVSLSKLLIRLKSGFGEKDDGTHFIDPQLLFTCHGPGLLLFELASHELSIAEGSMVAEEDEGAKVQVTSLVEELEFDMRGSVLCAGDTAATVTSAAVATSMDAIGNAKEQGEIRTRVLMKALSLAFQDEHGNETLTGKTRSGCIIVPAWEDIEGLWGDMYMENGVSYTIHRMS